MLNERSRSERSASLVDKCDSSLVVAAIVVVATAASLANATSRFVCRPFTFSSLLSEKKTEKEEEEQIEDDAVATALLQLLVITIIANQLTGQFLFLFFCLFDEQS